MKKLLIAAVLFVAASSGAHAKILLKTGAIDTNKVNRSNFMEANAPDTGLYLVEWKGKVTEADKAALQQSGLRIVHYVPENSFLVQGSRDMAAKAAQLAFVSAIVRYETAYKIEPQLSEGHPGVFALQDRVDITAELAPNADAAALKALIGRGIISFSRTRLEAHANLMKAWQLAARPDVLWVEKRVPFKILDFKAFDDGTNPPADPPPPAYTGYESGTKIMNVDAAYNAGFHGEGMITSYADTGLDKGDMANLLPDFQGQLADAINIALYGTSWGDPNGHGTHVAGSIASSGVETDGKIRGGAFKAKLIVEGMWSDMVDNLFPPTMDKVFSPAYQKGARIISNSWGASTNGRYDANAAAVDQFMFDHQDFLAIFAAGNDGADLNKDGVIDEGSLASPASAKNTLTVGASKNLVTAGGIQKAMKDLREGTTKWGVEPLASSMLSEDAKGMAAFSSRGPTQDGRIKPDVVAPGTNIVSDKSTHPKADATNGPWGPAHVFLSGTSMATPLTNGAVTLMRQYLTTTLKAQTVSAALLKATVANTAEDLFPGQFGSRAQGQEQPVPRPNNHEGWGRVNVANLLAGHARFYDERTGLATGQEKSFDLKLATRIRSGSGLHITMAYTDAAGSPSAAKALVNDLDLVVIDPSGKQIFPNHLSTKDSTNNMEQVDIANPMAGTYKVSVKAANVPQGINGAQPYALVVSGL